MTLSEVKLTTNDYSALTAMWCAKLADLAYSDESVCRDRIQEWDGVLLHWWDVKNTQGFAAIFDQTIVIAIRGTEPDQVKDLISDARLATMKGPFRAGDRVHRGFCEYAENLWEPISALCGNPATNSIILCGHSLGAAAAVLIAASLLDVIGGKRHHAFALYTFGCPRVGNRKFATILDYGMRGKHFRHVNACDVITRIPWCLGWYRHCGIKKYFTTNGRMLDKPPLWRVFSDRFLMFRRSPWSWAAHALTDHSMAKYRQLTLKEMT